MRTRTGTRMAVGRALGTVVENPGLRMTVGMTPASTWGIRTGTRLGTAVTMVALFTGTGTVFLQLHIAIVVVTSMAVIARQLGVQVVTLKTTIVEIFLVTADIVLQNQCLDHECTRYLRRVMRLFQ